MLGPLPDPNHASSSASAPTMFPSLPFTTFSGSSKTYSKRDMNLALEALKLKKMSLSRASEVYGIPPTTLWQRANRLGIPTPKKETSSKTWTEEDLNK